MTHHEKWDGSGYPNGLRGDEVPIEGRVVAIADVFDALTSQRPYKSPFTLERTTEIIREGKGKHFDPDVVDAFFAVEQEILDIKEDYKKLWGEFARIDCRRFVDAVYMSGDVRHPTATSTIAD